MESLGVGNIGIHADPRVSALEPCSEPLQNSRKAQCAKQDQHQADPKFHSQTKARRDTDLEKDDGCADGKNRQRVPQTPKDPDECGLADVLFLADDGCYGDDMVGVGGMPHSKNEPYHDDGKRS